MTYVISNVIPASDYNALAGITTSAAANSAAATKVAGYLWGVGYGDRGYGQTTFPVSTVTASSALRSSDWTSLRNTLNALCTWNQTSSALLPSVPTFLPSHAVIAHNSAAPSNNAFSLPDLLTSLDANRFNYNIASMTATASAATTTRSTTWGAGSTYPGDAIIAEFTCNFASEDAARFFFNTGGEIRIFLSHADTSSPRNQSWNTVLSGFVASFRANATARTGGSYGTGQSVGYFQLTTSYQTIIDGTDTGVSPYTVNDFYVEALTQSITGVNGAKGTNLQFRVRLIDQQTNAFSDIVNSGTVATLGHLVASGITAPPATPTCAVLTAF